MIVNVDHRTIGLLPDRVATDLTNASTGSFTTLEVERELLKVSDSSLAKAVSLSRC